MVRPRDDKKYPEKISFRCDKHIYDYLNSLTSSEVPNISDVARGIIYKYMKMGEAKSK